MGMIRTIKINDTEIFMPEKFKPQKTDIYAAEYTTGTGKTNADLIGWKFDDIELSWDFLPLDQLNVIANISGEGTIEFEYSGGLTKEKFRMISHAAIGSRETLLDGTQLWKNVTMSISFISVHN